MTMRRAAPTIALLSALVLLASGCSSDDHLTVTATFPDVLDLVEQAKVQTSDVRIGTVTAIELTRDNQAEVTMRVERGTGLPSEVEAVVRQTTLLGERYIDLVPLNESGHLASGRVESTRVVTDLEDLTNTGNELLAFIAADQLNSAIHAGATTFGGRGGTLGTVLTDLETFVGNYENGKDEVTRLLDNLDSLIGTLASEADSNAEVLEALARSAQALSEEDDRLLDALEDLDRLAVVGERILREHRGEIRVFFRRFRDLLDSLTRVDGALQDLLTWLPRHNMHVPNGIILEHAQIWQDLIICGTDDEVRDDPSRTCLPANPNQSNDPPPGHEHDECTEGHRDCPFPGDPEPGTDNGPDEGEEPYDGGDRQNPDGWDPNGNDEDDDGGGA